jgi:deazaflavin-dependent oxidoreductase (nitroreductase family)
VSIGRAVQVRLVRLQHAVYEHNGAIAHRMYVTRCLLLHTIGRRSGQRRSVVLLYVPDGEGFVVVASNWGGDLPPAWLLNLKENPRAEVQVGRRELVVDAQIVERGDDEYGRLWAVVNEGAKHRYRRYQEGTDRPIPVVRLAPVR